MPARQPPRRLGVLRNHVVASANPPFKRLFIANRGEIACRIHRAAKALGMETVGIYTEEDAQGLHCKVLDKCIKLAAGATPVAPYIDPVSVSEIAAREGCDAVHPGYGFMSEVEEFAALCEKKGVKFVGPSPVTIDLFGDKTKAKGAAVKAGLPVLEGSPGFKTADEALAFLKTKPMGFPLLLKASYGGGGRGQMVVEKPEAFAESFDKCSKEAEMSFGKPDVFFERYLRKAKHIEIQVLGDGSRCVHVFERDCSVQLRKQKVVEIAPSRGMNPALRERIGMAAARLCESVGYSNAGTVEFLVEEDLSNADAGFYFLELNPRIQVEHTITEEITGLDLVQTQIKIAAGATLSQLGIQQDKLSFKGFAIQMRVGLTPGGGGKVTEYREPAGVRVDSAIAEGTVAPESYDPMIAKVIVKGADFPTALNNARKALDDYVVGGLKVNKDFIFRILNHEDFVAGGVHTTWVEDLKLNMAPRKAASGGGVGSVMSVEAPFPGQVTEIKVKVGDLVAAGDVLVVLSAMKMLNDVGADRPGKVLEIACELNAQMNDGQLLMKIEATGDAPTAAAVEEMPRAVRRSAGGAEPLSSAWFAAGRADDVYATPAIRSKAKPSDAVYQKRMAHNLELAEDLKRRLDLVKGRSGQTMELHRARGKNLVRERIDKIIDPGTEFLELSALAAWEMHGGGIHSGGTVTGVGIVGGREVIFIGTDATIKGGINFPTGYKKWLRAQEVATQNQLPCVYLVDGGGSKVDPQAITTKEGVAGPKRESTFHSNVPANFVNDGRQFFNQAKMSALGIPQISVVCGICAAANAYVPALCDESIVVKDNGTIYLGAPALVKEATGEIADEQSLGGAAMHTAKSGTADHFAPDEDTALHMCREVVENLGGRRARTVLNGRAAPEEPIYDKDSMLGIIPESTNIPFDIREVIARIVDGSRFAEFKARYGATMVCGFAHIDGYPVGILGNNGMLFSESAIKSTHFIQLCGKRGIPLIFLHNITGFIIGTTYEQGGITKDGAKMITAVTNVPVPKITIVCGGSFGAGNYAMCGPAFDPRFTFLWPNARISVMGGEQAAGVVAIVKQNQLKREGKEPMSPEVEAKLKQPIIDSMEKTNSAWHSSAGVYDDGIIDPRDTRKVLAMAISISLNAPLPESHYGVFRM